MTKSKPQPNKPMKKFVADLARLRKALVAAQASVKKLEEKDYWSEQCESYLRQMELNLDEINGKNGYLIHVGSKENKS